MKDLLTSLTNPAAFPASSLLISWMVKSLLLLLLAFAASAALRRASASTRHLIWSTAFLGLLLFPFSGLVLPVLPLSVLPQPSDLSPAISIEEARDDNPFSAALSGAATPRSPLEASGAGGRHSAFSIPKLHLGWFLMVYGAGFVAIAGFFCLGLLQASRVTRRALPIRPDSRWRSLLDMVPTRRGRTRLLSSPEIRVPMTWGFLRPAIILPAEADGWPREEQKQALVHELAHVERRDWLMQLVGQLACAVYWFNPLVWIAARRLALEAERAADDRVILEGTDSITYANQLVSLVRRLRQPNVLPLTVLPMARRSQLPIRIQALLNPRLRRFPMKPQRRLSLSLVLIAGILALGSTQLAPAATNGTPLIVAVSDGDTEQVRELLAGGAEIDQKSRGRGTPLIAAAAAGDLEMTQLLLTAGADPNLVETASPRRHDLQRTALTAASRSGNPLVVSALLEAGAQVDRTPQGDATALIETLRSGHPEIARLLVEHGADVNRTVSGDGSPLIAAAQQGDMASVQFLLDAGADPNVEDRGDESPLYQAVGAGNRDLVRMLIEAGADVDAAVSGDGNALILASNRGDVDLVQEILAAGADVNLGVRGDGNPLIAAAREGHVPTLRYLVEAGAEIDLVIPGDENALIQAAGNGHLEAVKYLVAQGANVNARVIANGYQLRTPLLQAGRGSHKKVERYLRSAGAVE